MNRILEMIDSCAGNCSCGVKHETAIRDVQIGSGLVHQVGEILKKNGFSQNILLVADRNTLKAAEGIVESLEGFHIEYKIYDELRVAEMDHLHELEEIVAGRDISILLWVPGPSTIPAG